MCVGFTSCFFAEIIRSKKLLCLLDVLHILSVNQLISFCHIPVISLAVVARISKLFDQEWLEWACSCFLIVKEVLSVFPFSVVLATQLSCVEIRAVFY